MKNRIIILLIFLSGAVIAKSQHMILYEDADSLIRTGSDYIYNVQFDKARNCFSQIIEKYPAHPAGYFLDAMIDWWKIWLIKGTTKFDNGFLNKINKVIEVCDAILDTNSKDLNALFFKGGALGYRGRFYAVRKEWLDALTDGKTAFDILNTCKRIAPQNHDIMLGTGIYNYFAVKFPEDYPFLKPLMYFLPRGDKRIGLLQLQAAAKHSRYAATEAQVVRLQIFYSFEKNYTKALELARELSEKYPLNPYFQRYVGKTLILKGRLAEAEEVWRSVLNRYIDKYTGYDVYSAREALYYIGYSLMRKGRLEQSMKYFKKCNEACKKIDKETSGFMVKATLHTGKIYDLLGKRELAVKEYDKVISMKDYDNSHNLAEKFLQKPYGK